MTERRRTMLTAQHSTAQHSITASFSPDKSKTAYFFQAYSARFDTGGVRLFAFFNTTGMTGRRGNCRRFFPKKGGGVIHLKQ